MTTLRPNSEMLTIFTTEVLKKRYGTVRLELWPEGLVLWVGGEIVWKEWEGEDVQPRD